MTKKYALLISNSEYQDETLAQLVTPESDARSLGEVLGRNDIGSFDDVQVVLNRPSYEIQEAIAQFFAKRKRDDLLVLYFSGHGVLDRSGRLYLAAPNTKRDLLVASGIKADFITDVMETCRSRRKILILDCCHSGAFAKGSKSATNVSVGTGSIFEGSGYGHIVLTATDSTQYAWEGDEITGDGTRSVFTNHLVEGLLTGNADLNGDGTITVDELYDYAYARVIESAAEGKQQTPGKWAWKEQGDVIIAASVKGITTTPVKLLLPTEVIDAASSPIAGLRFGVVTTLKTLLTDDNRQRALAARQMLLTLSKDDSTMVSDAAKAALRPAGATSTAATAAATNTASTTSQTDTADKPSGLSLSPQLMGIIGAVVAIALIGFAIVRSRSSNVETPPPTVESVVMIEEPTVEVTEPVVVVAAEPIKLTVWHSFEGGAAQRLENVVAQFETANPDFMVELVEKRTSSRLSESDIYNDFVAAAHAANGPDVVLGGEGWAQELKKLSLTAPLDDKIDTALIDAVVPQLVETVRVDDELLGVPYLSSGVILYRNTQIVPDAPESLEAIFALPRNDYDLETGVFYSGAILNALGGELYDADGMPQFNSEAGIQWLDAIQQFGDDTYYGNQDLDAFRNNRTGLILDGTWNLVSVGNSVGWDNLIIDPWPEGMSGYVSANSAYMRPDIDEAREPAAIAFLEHIISVEAQLEFAQTRCCGVRADAVPAGLSHHEMVFAAYADSVSLPDLPNLEARYWIPLGEAIAMLDHCVPSANALGFAEQYVRLNEQKRLNALGRLEIAYQTDAADAGDIFLIDKDGGDPIRVTWMETEEERPQWSRDGEWISFISPCDGDKEIFRVRQDGTGLEQLTFNRYDDHSPRWSPDGRWLAYHRDSTEGVASIYIRDTTSFNTETRLTNSIQGNNYWPSWSADGSQLTFWSDRDGNLEIYVMDRDGFNQTNITNNRFADLDPFWSHDGERIAFYSNRGQNAQLYVVDPDGENFVQLTDDPAVEHILTGWSPDERELLYSFDGDVYRFNLSTGESIQVTDGEAFEWFGAWRP